MNLPFDLEKALVGEPVVTRDGRRVTELKIVRDSDSAFDLSGVMNEQLDYWTKAGTYMLISDTIHDLFMLNTTSDDNNP